jgi:DNA-directed RNA polymerase subunit RPC12/RpoP
MQVKCSQCGGDLTLQEEVLFVTCPFCGSALYLDRSSAVFHYVVRAIQSEEDALGGLRRWMAGNETVKDLDKLAAVTGRELIYFPMWRFVVHEEGQDREYKEMACAFSIPEIKKIPLSGGDLRFFDPSEFANAHLKPPDVLLESATSWLETRGVRPDSIKETSLIHIPFYLFKYQFRGTPYQAVVDGSSGRVLASVFPRKAEMPFFAITAIATLLFLAEGLAAPNILVRLILYVITAIPLGVVSYTVARRY